MTHEEQVEALARDLADALEELVRSVCPFCDPGYAYDKEHGVVFRHAKDCKGEALLRRADDLGILL